MILGETGFAGSDVLRAGPGWGYALWVFGSAAGLALTLRACIRLGDHAGKRSGGAAGRTPATPEGRVGCAGETTGGTKKFFGRAVKTSGGAMKTSGRAGGSSGGAVEASGGGGATIEFALVLPFLLLTALILLQTTFAMVGNLYVQYAAFAAARAAVVQIPADHGDPLEPVNTLGPFAGGDKFDRIHAAAVWAVVPISGQLEVASSSADAFADGLDALFSAQGRPVPNWVRTLAPGRVQYAADNTEVTLYEAVLDGGGGPAFEPVTGAAYAFGPREAVTVGVVHRFNLSVPYVRGIFADGTHQTAAGPGAYTELRARVTLTNEGIDPSLPPLPDLPRLDPN